MLSANTKSLNGVFVMILFTLYLYIKKLIYRDVYCLALLMLGLSLGLYSQIVLDYLRMVKIINVFLKDVLSLMLMEVINKGILSIYKNLYLIKHD